MRLLHQPELDVYRYERGMGIFSLESQEAFERKLARLYALAQGGFFSSVHFNFIGHQLNGLRKDRRGSGVRERAMTKK